MKNLQFVFDKMINVIQDISHTRKLDELTNIVRQAARELSSADGATFVLREGNYCHYVDEDAISPLWKGQRFPMEICVSGWVMKHRQQVVIEDIFADPRVPSDVYRATFVKSLAMVPIRSEDPIGAIGNYWATKHKPEPEELMALQALADAVSVAITNIQLQQSLDKRVQELRAAYRVHEEFLMSLSHELRTPLAVIAGWSDLLVKNGLSPEEQQRAVISICKNCKIQGQIVDDLLDSTRIMTGLLTLENRPLDLPDLIQKSILSMQAQAEAKSIVIHYEPEQLAGMVIGDSGRIKQVICNLLSNAIKFTPSGGWVKVLVDRSGPRVEIKIRDNGDGIDPEFLPHLFTLFKQADRGLTRKYGGLGLGLTLVHHLVNAHGGEVTAESEGPGKGSLFTVYLPMSELAPRTDPISTAANG